MFKPPLNLKKCRVLICNDDGINAPGIKHLEKVMQAIAKEVWVVAPELEQSGTAHSLTLRDPLRIRKISSRRYSVAGTPTDNVLLAVNQIMKGFRPDLVLSGFNRGANVGEDMTYSGTIAAAIEATLLGIPAIALSQQVDDKVPDDDKSAPLPVHWSTAETHAPRVIERLTKIQWPRDVLMNVNFPACPADKIAGIAIAREGRRKISDEVIEGRDPRGRPYYWIGASHGIDKFVPGTDIHALANHMVSITPVTVDLTHYGTVRKLRKVFKDGAKAA
jgi:5'-nucleotidase